MTPNPQILSGDEQDALRESIERRIASEPRSIHDAAAKQSLQLNNAPAPESESDAMREYNRLLADAAQDTREAKAEKSDPVRSAVDTTYQNIHEAYRARVANESNPVEESNEPTGDFDAEEFSRHLGFLPEVAKRLSFASHNEAITAVATELHQLEQGVNDDEADALARHPDLHQRIVAVVDGWRSPYFGRDDKTRSQLQGQRTHNLVLSAVKQSLALAKLNKPVADISTMLNRARLLHEPDHSPGLRGYKPARTHSANAITSIYDAVMKRPPQ